MSGEKTGVLKSLLISGLRKIHLEKWIDVASHWVEAKPRRYLWVLLTGSFFLAWGGFGDFAATGTSSGALLGEISIGNKEGVKLSFLSVCSFIWALVHSSGSLKLGVTAVVSFFICAAQTSFTTQRIKETLHFTADGHLDTLLLVLFQFGVNRAYRTEANLQTSRQHYASDVIAATSLSKDLKIMSLAGYEYIGAGKDSLLYSLLQSKPTINAEFIFLSSDKCTTIIAERVKRLKGRDSTITVDLIKLQIRQTMRLLDMLKTNRQGTFSVYTCACPIIFRLIILDDCLFVSAYKSNAHGHESPMLKIVKYDSDGRVTDWFDAFEQYYNSIKLIAEPTS